MNGDGDRIRRADELFEHALDGLDLGTELIAPGQPGDAEPLLERATAIRERAYGSDHSFLSAPSCRLGEIALAAGRPEETETSLRRATALARGTGDERDSETTRAEIGLARLMAARGEVSAARAALERELKLAGDEDRHDVAEAHAELGDDPDDTIETDQV